MPAATEPVHKGTLVCVVLKARNLPNKKSIGKQDPYTVLSMGQEQQKTKPDKRGGQHPTWDEQLHFEIYEDMEDTLANASDSGSKPTSASAAAAAKAKGGKKVLNVACYADDSKEPEFIGEGIVDLTETLKTGEFDEWVTIKAKDRYAGEVYLELTFYSSAAPPKKRKPQSKPVLSGSDTYGGAGLFQRIEEVQDAKSSSGSGSGGPPKPPKAKGDHPPIPASMRPGGSGGAASNTHNRMSSSISTSSLASGLHRPASSMSHSQTMYDLGSGTLRPSSSLANLDAYTPAYAPASISRSTSPVPPSSAYHSAAPSNMSSIGPAAGGSRRNSFAAPMPSEFGHSITPSASYYSQHSITPSQSSHYLINSHPAESSDDRYATIRPGAIVQQQQQQPQPQPQPQPQHQHQQYGVPRSHSISHIPTAYNQMPQPDFGADQLTQSMSQMGFGHSTSASIVTMDKPLPPPTPSHVDERPPQSHIYQAPAHLASLYTPPPNNGGYSQDLQRPLSPAARPASALSQYSTSPAAHTPSVVNAQAYYQQQQQQQQPMSHHGGHLVQPPSVPPRSSSPGAPSALPSGYTPIPSPYSQPAQSHVPRPLPSTQSSSSLSSAALTQTPSQQHAYPSHLYQPVQQPSPPPPSAIPSHQPQSQPQSQLSHSHSHSHSLSQSYSQNTWQGPPPPAGGAASSIPVQQSYNAANGNSSGGIASSVSSGYLYSQPPAQGSGRSASPLPPIPGSQQQQQQGGGGHLATSGSMHGFYGTSPSPNPAPAPPIATHGYHQQSQQGYQQYNSIPHYTQPQPPSSQTGYPHQYTQQQQQQQQQQQHYAQTGSQTPYHQQGMSSSQSLSSSLLYQSHQNNQPYQNQHQHRHAAQQQQHYQ